MDADEQVTELPAELVAVEQELPSAVAFEDWRGVLLP